MTRLKKNPSGQAWSRLSANSAWHCQNKHACWQWGFCQKTRIGLNWRQRERTREEVILASSQEGTVHGVTRAGLFKSNSCCSRTLPWNSVKSQEAPCPASSSLETQRFCWHRQLHRVPASASERSVSTHKYRELSLSALGPSVSAQGHPGTQQPAGGCKSGPCSLHM